MKNYHLKNTIKKMKTKATDQGKKYLQYTYLTKYLCQEYTKNS